MLESRVWVVNYLRLAASERGTWRLPTINCLARRGRVSVTAGSTKFQNGVNEISASFIF